MNDVLAVLSVIFFSIIIALFLVQLSNEFTTVRCTRPERVKNNYSNASFIPFYTPTSTIKNVTQTDCLCKTDTCVGTMWFPEENINVELQGVCMQFDVPEQDPDDPEPFRVGPALPGTISVTRINPAYSRTIELFNGTYLPPKVHSLNE